MANKISIEQLDSKIKKLQDYLGWRVHYNSDKWPDTQPERWLMEYLDLLKRKYYRKIFRERKKKSLI